MKGRQDHKKMIDLIETKEKQKLKERRKTNRSVLYGLGMFGMIGWSIAVPAILGTMLGLWLDKRMEGTQSWTLTFLLVGLIAGCAMAWFWLQKEHKKMHKEDDIDK